METFQTITPGMVAVILVGITILGGAIGSFLNVVIYRLPAGLSLIHPPSRCPRCEHPIRAYDNVPVFGWLLLGGKCRDCRAPISVRYPMIEAVVAMMFLTVAWLEWSYSLGLPPGLLIARVSLHLILLTTLLGVGMIEWDRGRVPKRMWLPVVLTGIVLWGFFSTLTVWPAWGYKPTLMAGLIDGLVGAVAGLAIGGILCFIDRLQVAPDGRLVQRGPLLLGCLSVGLVLGWQMIALIGLVYLPILLVGVLLQRTQVTKRALPHGLCLFTLTLVSIVAFCLAPL